MNRKKGGKKKQMNRRKTKKKKKKKRNSKKERKKERKEGRKATAEKMCDGGREEWEKEIKELKLFSCNDKTEEVDWVEEEAWGWRRGGGEGEGGGVRVEDEGVGMEGKDVYRWRLVFALWVSYWKAVTESWPDMVKKM